MSARMLREPDVYLIVAPYSASKPPHRWIRAFCISLVKRAFNGLWSVKTVNKEPYRQGRNLFMQCTMAYPSNSQTDHFL